MDSQGIDSPTGTFSNGTGLGNDFFSDNLGDEYLIDYDAIDPANLDPSVSLTLISEVPEPDSMAMVLPGIWALIGTRWANPPAEPLHLEQFVTQWVLVYAYAQAIANTAGVRHSVSGEEYVSR